MKKILIKLSQLKNYVKKIFTNAVDIIDSNFESTDLKNNEPLLSEDNFADDLYKKSIINNNSDVINLGEHVSSNYVTFKYVITDVPPSLLDMNITYSPYRGTGFKMVNGTDLFVEKYNNDEKVENETDSDNFDSYMNKLDDKTKNRIFEETPTEILYGSDILRKSVTHRLSNFRYTEIADFKYVVDISDINISPIDKNNKDVLISLINLDKESHDSKIIYHTV